MNKGYKGRVQSPVGDVWLVWDSEGIRQIYFDENPSDEAVGQDSYIQDDETAQRLFDGLLHYPPIDLKPFALVGTPFQRTVWQALLSIPSGAVITYRQLAGKIGRPKAVRAVANAVGANPIAWLIPCHRVVRSDGGLGGYRWGVERKREILEWEQNLVSRAA